MAPIYALGSTPNSLVLSSYPSSLSNPLHVQFPHVKYHKQIKISLVVKLNEQGFLKHTKIRAMAEGEALVLEEDTLPPAEATSPDQAVSVAVSPSDVLTMFFLAEGTMSDLAIPAVTKALEDVKGIADLRVQVLEGIASVELRKQTTIQATGVASNLVETIQGSGFKLHTLNLSFQDEEDFS